MSLRSIALKARKTLYFSVDSKTRPFLRIPAVSIILKIVPSSSSNVVSMASRVVPATLDTMTRSSPSIAFTKLDFPTFGRPIKLNLITSLSSSSSFSSGKAFTAASNKSPSPNP